MKLIIILCNILILLYWPVNSRQCYECNCDYDWDTSVGTCSSPTFQSSCILKEVGNNYCILASYYDNSYEQRSLTSIAPDTFQDSHFFQAVEVISLSGTAWLPTAISSIIYGCDWDGCTNNSLVQYLPGSFQMNINATILNSELLNGQSPAQNCYTCSRCFSGISAILCTPGSCTNGICYIDEQHNYITTPTNNCTYNFFSYCQALTNPVQTSSVRIRATYYIDLPTGNQLEINEVDITCTKDYCNSIETVEYLKGQIQTSIQIDPGFRPSRPNDTATVATTTDTVTIATTTEGSASIRLYPVVFLYAILFLLLL